MRSTQVELKSWRVKGRGTCLGAHFGVEVVLVESVGELLESEGNAFGGSSAAPLVRFIEELLQFRSLFVLRVLYSDGTHHRNHTTSLLLLIRRWPPPPTAPQLRRRHRHRHRYASFTLSLIRTFCIVY